jgi:uncharacterized protein (TIGR02145 family)
MKKTLLLIALIALLTTNIQAQTVTDIDGNIYKTVKIGSQLWMKENLKTTHYNNGQLINRITHSQWDYTNMGAMCYYNNDSAKFAKEYGALYNWYAASDNKNICPIFWHVPSHSEWNILEKFLDENVDTTAVNITGMDIGLKLKDTAIFAGLYGGCRLTMNSFELLGTNGYWWSTTPWEANISSIRHGIGIDKYYETKVNVSPRENINGYSIRCISDSIFPLAAENKIEKQIQIYPNPAISNVFIDCGNNQGLSISINNMLGECILQREMTTGLNQVDISSLSPGIYIIQLFDNENTITKKLIKSSK